MFYRCSVFSGIFFFRESLILELPSLNHKDKHQKFAIGANNNARFV
jgi:hypothetical protein